MCQGCHFVHMEDGTKVPAPENQNGPLLLAIPALAFVVLMALALMVMTWPGLLPWCRN
jgi:hypothetical protein